MVNTNPFTFSEILQIVFPDKTYRQKLIDEMSQEQIGNQYEIKQIVWGSFWKLFEELSNLKYKEMLSSIAAGESKYQLNPYLLRQARQAIWQDFHDMLSGKKQETEQIEDIRTKLQELMKESKIAKIG